MRWNDPIMIQFTEWVHLSKYFNHILSAFYWSTFASPGWFEEAPVKQPKKKKWAFCVIAGKENSGFEKYGQEKSLLFQGMLRVIPWIMGNNSISMHKFRFKPLFQSGIKMLSSQSWLLYVYRSKQKQHGTIVTLASNLILLSAVELSIGRCTPRVVTIS